MTITCHTYFNGGFSSLILRKHSMAKKKSKRVAPTRACEACATPYHPRSKACPKCGAANPTIGQRRISPRRGARGAGGAEQIDAAINFVEQAGGFRAAKAALDKIERIKEL